MRQWGFDLFDLSLRRYSTGALPAPFEYDGPAQTIFGRPYQGDAIYLRDPMTTGGPHCPVYHHIRCSSLRAYSNALGCRIMLPSWFVPMLGICLVFAILMNSWIPLLTRLIRDLKVMPSTSQNSQTTQRRFIVPEGAANSGGVLNEEKFSSALSSLFRRRLSGIKMQTGKLLKQMKQAIAANR